MSRRYTARIVAFATEHHLPVIGGLTARGFVDAGALMGYGARRPDLFRRAATYVDRILKGARPVDMPVEEPMLLDLVINLKTAQALEITFPESILVQTTEVIR